ncbi:chemotaxis response regulator protein-glutamate methylesterase [Seohaeicola saemankumensis]|uniref:protein-glutamate methylesterase/protein-glutamine glutaminase n=1 Tax=Seohaeicola saemankumensis TaxID=481181 RepID=UPI001E370A66|nr:chemotaxis response regulator protein-glutamate methylesterase [Seohaeicola saemankumensis]MCD1625122.1 chemotaxis response regulator protein-glutamate methylesterase [Seohaeicola saemankumensis]
MNTLSTRRAAVRVLIVDDSAMIRKVLSMGLSTDPMIEVVGTASGAEQASEMIRDLRPEVMTLDIEMPRMDGVTFLRQLMPVNPLPTVIISSATQRGAAVTLQALEAGAVDVIAKPSLAVDTGLKDIMADVCRRVRAAALARPSQMAGWVLPMGVRPPSRHPENRIIAIGASTGGVQALARVLHTMPQDAPGIVIVQHMPQGFTKAFADRLNAELQINVREAQDGDRVQSGVALIAPGGSRHMVLAGTGPHWRVSLVEGDPVCFSRPAVDTLFHSVARHAGKQASAALLTGMGKDGAAGLLAIRHAGGNTLAQDEATSVVWGMPAAAVDLNAAMSVKPLDAIGPSLLAAAANPVARGTYRFNSQEGTAS